MSKPPSKLPPKPPAPPPPARREEAMEFLRWMFQQRTKRKEPWRTFNDKEFRDAVPEEFASNLGAIARRIFSDMVRGSPPAKERPQKEKPPKQGRRKASPRRRPRRAR